jgi:hypothetical protein
MISLLDYIGPLLIGYVIGAFSTIIAMYVGSRLRDASHDHNPWDGDLP